MRRILVVNDSEIRPITARLLEIRGYTVDMADDGFDVIEHLTRDEYDAVVLDVTMPRVNGRGVLVHLARTNPTMIGRTVLVASVAEEAVESQLNEIVRVLVKPFAIGDLLDAIEECAAA